MSIPKFKRKPSGLDYVDNAFELQKDEFEIVKKLMKEVMESVIELEVPLLIDIEYGDNWYQAK